ncbi:MAG: DUF3073 domain-containing protein [Micrococcales bacterium]
MGRGRQKAKHTKVARELKYFSPNTDLEALEREIGHVDESAGEEEFVDKWADLYDDEDEDGEPDEPEENPEATK